MSGFQKGRLVVWKDDKGFGFVRPEQGDQDYFVHISVFRKGMSRRPNVGDCLRFEVATDDSPGKNRVARAEIEGMDYEMTGVDAGRGRYGLSPLWIKIAAVLPITLSIYVLWEMGNPLPFFTYTFMSMLTILYYAADKKHSITGQWRVPEQYFHVFELLGGWPGALLAQQQYRHKVRKKDYQTIFWAIVIMHQLGWLAFAAMRARTLLAGG